MRECDGKDYSIWVSLMAGFSRRLHAHSPVVLLAHRHRHRIRWCLKPQPELGAQCATILLWSRTQWNWPRSPRRTFHSSAALPALRRTRCQYWRQEGCFPWCSSMPIYWIACSWLPTYLLHCSLGSFPDHYSPTDISIPVYRIILNNIEVFNTMEY